MIQYLCYKPNQNIWSKSTFMLPFNIAFFASDSPREYKFSRNGRNRAKMRLFKYLSVTPINKVVIRNTLPTRAVSCPITTHFKILKSFLNRPITATKAQLAPVTTVNFPIIKQIILIYKAIKV